MVKNLFLSLLIGIFPASKLFGASTSTESKQAALKNVYTLCHTSDEFALWNATLHNNQAEVKRLLALDTNPLMCNSNMLLIGIAIRNGNTEITDLLLEKGAHAYDASPFEQNKPCLLMACGSLHSPEAEVIRAVPSIEEQLAVVKRLLACPGVDINDARYFGETPLMHAAGHAPEIVAELLARKANPFQKCEQQRTALMWCAIISTNKRKKKVYDVKEYEITKLLVEAENEQLSAMSANPEITKQKCDAQKAAVIEDRAKTAKMSTDTRSRCFLARQNEQAEIARLISLPLLTQEIQPHDITNLVMQHLGDDSADMKETDFKLFKKNSSLACVVS